MGSITTDVVIVGSGAAGLLATVTARAHGMEAILVEASTMLGGSSAMSGGMLWLPGNHLMTAIGESDSPQVARTYLDACIGAVRPASTAARRNAYVETAPVLAHWLEELGVKLEASKKYPDYYPELSGGKQQGRTVECAVTDASVLGEWRKECRFTSPIAFKSAEAPALSRSLRSPKGFLTAANAIAGRTIVGKLTGKNLVGGGAALVTNLLRMVLDSGAGLWREAPLTGLIMDDDRVSGVVVNRNGHEMPIRARRGVILAAGGFEKNQELRQRFLPKPTEAQWSLGAESNQGGWVKIAEELGLAFDLMDEAWWTPAAMIKEQAHPIIAERGMPHSMIVDRAGDRFFNESAPYDQAGQSMYRHRMPANGVPAFLIMDARHRNRYPLAWWFPGWTPLEAVRRGDIVKAETLYELAEQLGIDKAGLLATVIDFNEGARQGKDRHFGRGESRYDQLYSDPYNKPNPCLGGIEKAPFWGLKIVPGDLGTKGGVVTDERARVLRADGSILPGLYAVGNCSASVMGHANPGAGATLGAACVFAYLAVLDLETMSNQT